MGADMGRMEMMRSMMAGGMGMPFERKMLSGSMAILDRSEASMKGLYSALSPEQRTAFDQMMSGPMG